jgi:hypothetical protein
MLYWDFLFLKHSMKTHNQAFTFKKTDRQTQIEYIIQSLELYTSSVRFTRVQLFVTIFFLKEKIKGFSLQTKFTELQLK